MSATSGFKLSRAAVTSREGPRIALPEQGDAARLHHLSTSLKEFGDQREAYADEIAKLWREASERFLTIGRYLARAKERLPHGNYEAMIAADLPFGRHVARQFRMIAAAVDGGRIEEDELPTSYTTAYKLIELRDDNLERARQERLLRPNVTRREVVVFVKRLNEEVQGQQSHAERFAQEREALQKRAKALSEELRSIKQRLTEIEMELQSA